MGYQFIEHLSDQELNEFVSQSSCKSIYQFSAWAKVKNTWNYACVGVKEEGVLKAAGMILFRQLAGGLTMGYMTRGPILDYEDTELMRFFFSELKKFGKKRKAVLIKFDPNIKIASVGVKEKEEAQNARADELVSRIVSCGAQFLGYELDMTKNIQPRFQMNFPIEGNIEDRFSSKQKKKIAQSLKKGVVIEASGSEKVKEFAQMVQFTEKRKGISLRNEDYFKVMMEAYEGHSTLMLASIDFDEALRVLNEEFREVQKQILELPEKAAGKRKTLADRSEKLSAEIAQVQLDKEETKEHEFISGLLILEDGTTAELLYSGLNERYRKYLPAYSLRAEAIKWAQKKGCRHFNFGGVQGSLDDGLFEFKSSFNPLIDVYIGEFDLPCMELMYPLMTKMIPVAKSAMKKLRSIKKR